MWGLPVAEADAVVLGVTSEVDDDAHEQQTNQREHLDATKPELELAKKADSEKVHSEDCETRINARSKNAEREVSY